MRREADHEAMAETGRSSDSGGGAAGRLRWGRGRPDTYRLADSYGGWHGQSACDTDANGHASGHQDAAGDSHAAAVNSDPSASHRHP
jgi:hypothetical protein